MLKIVKDHLFHLNLVLEDGDVPTPYLVDPSPSCPQMSLIRRPLPPSKMVTSFMDGPPKKLCFWNFVLK